MAELLQWELSLPGRAGRVLEHITLHADGVVERVVLEPGSVERPEVGWKEGHLDAASLGAAAALAASPWPGSATLPSPPAAGAWWVAASGGRYPLWSDEDDDAAVLRAQLAAVRDECADAAATARCVGRFWATWSPLDGEWHPLLYVEAIGRERLSLVIDDAPGTGPASFLTEKAEVLGYSGSEMWVPPGVCAFGLLSDRQPGPVGLEITGRLHDEARTRLAFRAVVAVSDGEP